MNAKLTTRVIDFSRFRSFGWSIHGFNATDVFADAFESERLVVERAEGLFGRASSKLSRGGRLVRKSNGRAHVGRHEQIGRSADLLFAFATDLGDLEILSATRADWSPNHRIKVLWLSEAWESMLSKRHAFELDFLRDFSLVICSAQQTVRGLRGLVDGEAIHLLQGVDVLGTPWKAQPSIDFLNIGRRSPAQHESIVKLQSEIDCWYHFDTFGPPTYTEPYVHRQVTASLYANAAVSISNYARFDQLEVIGGFREVGVRYFEAIAAGAVMAGEHPTDELFESSEGFGELEGVQHLSLTEMTHPDELVRLLKIGNTPMVREELRRRACLRHDWAHRISDILRILEIPPPENLQTRIRALADDAP